MWFQKPPETVSEVVNFKNFLGEHAPDPLVWVRYHAQEFPLPPMKKSCINPYTLYNSAYFASRVSTKNI